MVSPAACRPIFKDEANVVSSAARRPIFKDEASAVSSTADHTTRPTIAFLIGVAPPGDMYIYIYIITFSLAIPTIAGFGVSDSGSLVDPPEHHLNGSFNCITELIYRSTLYLWPCFILNRVQIPRNLWCKSPESTEKSRCTDEFVSTLPGLSMCLVALSGACIMKISSSAGVPIMGVPDQGMRISDFEDLAGPGGRENL